MRTQEGIDNERRQNLRLLESLSTCLEGRIAGITSFVHNSLERKNTFFLEHATHSIAPLVQYLSEVYLGIAYIQKQINPNRDRALAYALMAVYLNPAVEVKKDIHLTTMAGIYVIREGLVEGVDINAIEIGSFEELLSMGIENMLLGGIFGKNPNSGDAGNTNATYLSSELAYARMVLEISPRSKDVKNTINELLGTPKIRRWARPDSNW